MFAQTGAVMTSLVDRLGYLKDAILDLAEQDNFYAMSVLFRVFLEHILRANVIFMKAASEHSDDFANRYQELVVSEAFDYLRAYKAAGLDMAASPKTVLDQWFPRARSLAEKDIRKLAEPFRYLKLIRTTRDLLGAKSPDFLTKIIPNYSELSGFVHGGPSAAEAIARFGEDDSRRAEMLRIADLTIRMFHSAERWLLVLASSVESGLKRVLDQLSDAIDRSDTDANKPDACDG
jgi:hypothetical protein